MYVCRGLVFESGEEVDVHFGKGEVRLTSR